ncbi:MAG: carboxyltransferase domain-containing protein [Candidatus Nanopelagicales bacterium]
MNVTPFGEDGWLIAVDDPIAVAGAIDARRLDDVVPGQNHVLLRGRRSEVEAALAGLPDIPSRRQAREPVVLPAVWDGPDLGDVAGSAGTSVAGVVDAMRATTFTVAFCGFAPGFGYLTGVDARLHLPRRQRPRPSVPAGAIAIAAGYCAVYPTASPGGWHLIGTCDATLFSPDRQPPALLRPGDRVRFA